MHISEDPNQLTLGEWISRVSNLPFREIIRRIFNLVTSFSFNVFGITRIYFVAKSKSKKLHFIILTDRMGDIIAAEPTLRSIVGADEYVVWLLRPRFLDVLRFNPMIDERLSVSSYTETVGLRLVFKFGRWTNFQRDKTLCNIFGLKVVNQNTQGIDDYNYYNHGSLTHTYALIVTGKKSLWKPEVFPDPDFNAASYLNKIFTNSHNQLIVIHFSSDENARSWDPIKCRKLVTWILKNTDANIIELGLNPTLSKQDRIFFLRDFLPLSCQFSVISIASLFIGVDSGFSHVANSLKRPSILLLGKYHDFQSYLPWETNEQDIVIRSEKQVSNIPADEVIDALKKFSLQYRDANSTS